ncbi:ornithine uptake porin CarO [Acinetobacter sp. MD2(2019)]|uniref:ornithine uptake porin CarO n=1 Tax=Acinetobacter sp. MD2(2019) TaxID=2605273 RepID=UPI002D1F0CF5|nr:ornithine uptake porin CarO [Acinetobacter sp. MD2(2019)]MEB3753505.1 ornithine uptake porin CarO [Acinetobacter sp. MD2(2019)]
MYKIRKLLICSAFATVAGYAMADEQVIKEPGNTYKTYLPSSVRAEGGTTGYGGAFTWDVNPIVGVTLGYNGGNVSWSDNLKVNGSKYDLDMNNNNVYLNAEIHPWGNSQGMWAKSAYVAAGAAYLDNDYDITRNVSNGRNFSVNNTDFNATSDVKMNGKLSYKNDIAPYVGLGLRPMFSDHWGMFSEVGAYYVGNPSVNLNSTGTATNGNGVNLNDAVAAEENKIASSEKYKWMPSAKVGVVYKF